MVAATEPCTPAAVPRAATPNRAFPWWYSQRHPWRWLLRAGPLRPFLCGYCGEVCGATTALAECPAWKADWERAGLPYPQTTP